MTPEHTMTGAARLREALERIARVPHSGDGDSQACARERGRIAREALEAVEARADYDAFIEGLTAKLNAAGVPAMPSWPDAIRLAEAAAEARAATLREKDAAHEAVVQELRMAVTALGWVKTAFRKIDEGTEATPSHCRAADAERAYERGMAALRQYDALIGRCCGGGRAPCPTHYAKGKNW
jgi:hypothetical protein